ncbi:uncharacterized protein [Prorops nasuta]
MIKIKENYSVWKYVKLTSSQKSCRTLQEQKRISHDHILNIAQYPNDILREIKSTYVGKEDDSEALNSLQLNKILCRILRKFQKNHRKINYFNFLKQTLKSNVKGRKKKKSSEEEFLKYQLPWHVLSSFLCKIFHFVVPKCMFGSNRNGKCIKKAISAIIRAPFNAIVDIYQYIQKTDINSIWWTKFIPDNKAKAIIVSKLFKWLIVEYFVQILYSQVYIVGGKQNNMQFFILIKNWKKMEKKFLKKYLKNGTYQLIEADNCHIITKLCLVPKYDSLRPIVSLKDHKSRLNEWLAIKILLQQLYYNQNDWKCDSFQSYWRDVQNWNKSRETKGCFVVSTDIKNAFSSIILEKLYDIVLHLFETIPEVIKLQEFSLTTCNSYFLKSMKYFVTGNLPIPLPANCLYATKITNKYKNKSEYIKSIKQYIFCQIVDLRNEKYLVKKGVLQGMPISSILSDIYYSYIFHRYINIGLRDRLFYRYADDLLFITDEIDDAIKLLHIILEGVGTFNCRFNRSKTQANIFSFNWNDVGTIKYLGYTINIKDLSVEPRYDIHPRYTVYRNYKRDKPLCKVLRKTLDNKSFLKLGYCIYSNIYTTLNIVHQIIRIDAERTYCYLKDLFNDRKEIPSDVRQILIYDKLKLADIILSLLEKNKPVFKSYSKDKWKTYIRNKIFYELKRVLKCKRKMRNLFI